MIFQPVTITSILTDKCEDVVGFLNTHVLNQKLPIYTANHPIDVRAEIIPRLSLYANNYSYVIELFNVVLSAYFRQKANKRAKNDEYDEEVYTGLEAKKEILYRTAQSLDRLYEAASRIMTGIGEPDPRTSRHP
jgi:hypothetical protein